MCTVSYIGDNWRTTAPAKYPWVSTPEIVPYAPTSPTRDEFETLRREMEELRELLRAAKKYDAATDQPNCEMEEKVELIKKFADVVGVDMEDIFGEHKNQKEL